MAKGFKIKYSSSAFTFGSGFGPDKSTDFSSMAIYVPSEQLFIKRDRNTDCLYSSDPEKIYIAYVGRQAEQEYRDFMKRMEGKKGCKPKETEIPDSVVEWGKALAVAKNAPEDVRKFMDI
jgi:hypothetical protein